MADQSNSGTMPTAAVVVLAVVAAAVVFGATGAFNVYWLMQLLTDLGQLILLTVAAGGIGYAALRRFLPAGAPRGLALASAVGLGLWILGTLVLCVGTSTHGLLKNWLWWPLTALGVLAALWQGRGVLAKLALPNRVDGRALIWVLLAAAAALWLSGATYPPGWCQLEGDGYDVLEYHLQVPREYFLAQHIAPLHHNCYSFYPMGAEMLYLLAMILRGGAYEGMYLANLIHGLYLVMAVMAVFATLRKEDDSHARFSAVLLGTAPLLLYLGFMAMVELSAIFYLALALLWLRHWLKAPAAPAAAMIGLAVGAACATKYIAVGMVAAPVLVVMLVTAVGSVAVRRSGKNALTGTLQTDLPAPGAPEAPRECGMMSRLGHTLLAGALALALMSPWLVRNAVYTGNPVFPLATNVFGPGYWSPQSQERWNAGHGPRNLPPVPPPPINRPPLTQIDRLTGVYTNFIGDDRFGLPLMVLTVVAAAMVLAGAGAGGAWGRSLLAVLAIQVVLWATLSHGMPPRFLAVAMVPMTLLAGGALAGLAKVAKNPLRKSAPAPAGGPWGLPVAAVILVVTALVNLATAYGMLRESLAGKGEGAADRYVPGTYVESDLSKFFGLDGLPSTSKVAVLGEARMFYMPSNAIYATAFDADGTQPVPLGGNPQETLRNLRRIGVTHILINWQEMVRLATSYGYPAAYVDDLFSRGKIGVRWADQLGLSLVKHIQPPQRSTTAPATGSAPASQSAAAADFHGDRFIWNPDQRFCLPLMSLYQLPPAEPTK